MLDGKTLNAHSYDMLTLFTGSEGLFGEIIEVTVKLLPVPERAQVVLATFDDRLVLVSQLQLDLAHSHFSKTAWATSKPVQRVCPVFGNLRQVNISSPALQVKVDVQETPME